MLAVFTVSVGFGSQFLSLLVIRLLGVTMTGSIPSLFVFHGIFLLSGLSIGVFVATITNTLQPALLTSFFGLFPLLFLSGSIAPIESMPWGLQVASEASLLRHYIEIVSGLFLKGAGIVDLWGRAAALLAISASMFFGSWLIFRRSW